MQEKYNKDFSWPFSRKTEAYEWNYFQIVFSKIWKSHQQLSSMYNLF